MRRLIYFIVSFIVWLLLTWPLVEGVIDWQMVIAGVIAAAIVSILFHEILPKEQYVFTSPVRIFWAIVYIPVFFYYFIHILAYDIVNR